MNNKINKIIAKYKENGISVLEPLTEKELSKLLSAANKEYYNDSESLLTDNQYDIVKEFVERKFPAASILKEIGAPVIEKNKVRLPYEMPSMDKIKPDTDALDRWKINYRGPYVLSCKLDGVSGLYTIDKETGVQHLYTRGNGTVGQDIDHFLPHLQPSLPNPKPNHNFAVRGEFILKKEIFETKYKTAFANSRNLVSGIINSKQIDEKTRDLDFVAYEIVSPPMRPSEQMKLLKHLGFNVVQFQSVREKELNHSILSDLLLDWRANYEYEIDGVIVTDDKEYRRVSGNPEHAFAFKMVISDQMAEAKVVDVIWTPSKDGYLKPRVRIEPIKLGGVTIEYATGFNAKFIEDNRIGIGAVIILVRSGDVIPFIQSVTNPAETAKMPVDMNYRWNDTHVDILLVDIGSDATVMQKCIAGFFTSLEVDGLSIGNVKRLYAAGYDSISKVLRMDVSDFEKVEGFKQKMSEKVYKSMREKIEAASLLDIMVASNKMGRGLGINKLTLILNKYPDICLTKTETNNQKIAMLKTIQGIGQENANDFVNHIPDFLDFLEECDLTRKLYDTEKNETNTEEEKAEKTGKKDNPLFGKKIVMTKTRDPAVINIIKESGGVLSDNIKQDTYILVVKSKTDTSNKLDYAKKNQIPIMTPEEFLQQFA